MAATAALLPPRDDSLGRFALPRQPQGLVGSARTVCPHPSLSPQAEEGKLLSTNGLPPSRPSPASGGRRVVRRALSTQTACVLFSSR
jgi:hypothetical protein